MKKLSLLLGTLGGAVAGYLFSNSKLREELSAAKDAEAAGRILGRHLTRDGKRLGVEVKKFVESDDVQKNLKKAKGYVQDAVEKAGKEMQGYIEEGAKQAKKAIKDASKGKKAFTKRKV